MNRRHDSPAKGEEGGGEGRGGGREKTSSGYFAGLQSGKDFKVVEQQLKQNHVRLGRGVGGSFCQSNAGSSSWS